MNSSVLLFWTLKQAAGCGARTEPDQIPSDLKSVIVPESVLMISSSSGPRPAHQTRLKPARHLLPEPKLWKRCSTALQMKRGQRRHFSERLQEGFIPPRSFSLKHEVWRHLSGRFDTESEISRGLWIHYLPGIWRRFMFASVNERKPSEWWAESDSGLHA